MIYREDLVVCLQFKSYHVVISSQVLACKDSGYDWFEQLLQNVRFFFLEQTMRVIMTNETNNLLWFGRLKTYPDLQTWFILHASLGTLAIFFLVLN